jgi:arylsulfatase A-like enzyme
MFARQAEVFAGYVAYSDHEIGRVIQDVENRPLNWRLGNRPAQV